MPRVYRGLLSFVTRTALFGAILFALAQAPRQGAARPPAGPRVRLPLDPEWAAEVDRRLDARDPGGLTEGRSVPVLIDRLLQPRRSEAAALALERLFEDRRVTGEDGAPVRVRARSVAQHDVLAEWYQENRARIESTWRPAPVE